MTCIKLLSKKVSFLVSYHRCAKHYHAMLSFSYFQKIFFNFVFKKLSEQNGVSERSELTPF